jgi:hypothetical protein
VFLVGGFSGSGMFWGVSGGIRVGLVDFWWILWFWDVLMEF